MDSKVSPLKNSKYPSVGNKKTIHSLFLAENKLLFCVCPSVIVLCHLYCLALVANLIHFHQEKNAERS